MFTTPSGSTGVTADTVVDAAGGIYNAYADVTGLMAGNGTYAVADIQTAAGSGTFGGWSLVVVVHNQAEPARFLLVAAPGATISSSSSWTAGFDLPTPMTGASADVLLVGFEGDPGLTADQLDVCGQVTTNPFRATVPGLRAPSTPNTFGTDIAAFPVVGLNGATFSVAASSGNDRVQFALLAVALTL